MTKDEIKKKIMEDEDFIKNPKYGNSLSKFLSKNTKELEDPVIARILMISEEEVADIYQKAIGIIRAGVVKNEQT